MSTVWMMLRRLGEHKTAILWLLGVMALSSVPVVVSWWVERRRFVRMRDGLRLEVDVEQRRARDLLRFAEERREREKQAAESAAAEKKAYEEKINEYERLVKDPDALSIALENAGRDLTRKSEQAQAAGSEADGGSVEGNGPTGNP